MQFPLRKTNAGLVPNVALLSTFALVSLIGSPGARALDAQRAPAGGMKLGGSTASIYHEGWIDLNKNGRKDVYEDPEQPVEKRVEDLLAQMTVKEKWGQVRSSQFPQIAQEARHLVAKGELGGILDCQPAEQRNALQRAAVENSRLGIPLRFEQGESSPVGGLGEAAESCRHSLDSHRTVFLGGLRPAGLRLLHQDSSQTVDASVRKVLRAKFLKGLFEKPYLRSKPVCEVPVEAT